MAKKPIAFDITGKVAPFPLKKFLKFISHLKVQSRDFGRIPFKLLGTQKYILDEVVKGLKEGITVFVILKGRQIGSSTFFIALDMFYGLEYPGLQGAMILHEERALDRWRAIIDIFIDTLPKKVHRNGRLVAFRPDVQKHNRNILWFKNDSLYSYLIAGTTENKSGGGLGRSGSSNFVHGTECAQYGSEEDVAAFKSQVSSLYAHRLQVWESTAKGFNHWYNTCQAAKESPTMRFIFVGWWRNELFQLHVKDPRYASYMPDETISRLERSRVKAVLEKYGFHISLQQIAWHRWKLSDEFNGDQVTMDQEFPWTEEDAFQSGKSKYFEGPTLTELTRVAVKNPYQGYRYKVTERWEELDVVDYPDPRSELHIWQHASRFGYYVLGCDPAYGSSDKADWNVISIWRAYAECIVQVAEFTSKRFSTSNTAWVIAHLGGFYGTNDCRVNIELNGPGKAVFGELKEVRARLAEMRPKDDKYGLKNCMRNMRDYYFQRIDTMGGEYAYHTITSEDMKRHLLAQFKDGVELRRIIPMSMTLIEEMRKLVNEDGHIEAAEGHDDHVMAAMLAYEAYVRWLKAKLISIGMSRARSLEIEAKGGDKPITKLIHNYLRQSNILLPS